MLPHGHLLLTLSWRTPLSYRNQSIDSQSKSMDWFLYDKGLRHERVNMFSYFGSFRYLLIITLLLQFSY